MSPKVKKNQDALPVKRLQDKIYSVLRVLTF